MFDDEESQPMHMPDPDDDEEETYVGEEARSPRFVSWFAYLIFSLVTLGSSIEATDSDEIGRVASNQKWAIACSSITFFITAIVVFLHISPITALFIVNTRLEFTCIVTLIGFWAATAAVVSNADNGLAVDEAGAVVFGNLYYFTWGGFVTSITLLVSYLRSVYHIDVAEEMRVRSARLNAWTALMVFSLIMMGSSANIYDDYCQGNSSSFCMRTILAVSIGAMGTVFSLIMLGVKIGASVSPFWLEAGFIGVQFFCLSFGVAFITGEQGPGAPLGNLYYSTWAAFASTFIIGSSVFEEYHTARMKRLQEEEGEEEFIDEGQGEFDEEFSQDDLQSLDNVEMNEPQGHDGMRQDSAIL